MLVLIGALLALVGTVGYAVANPMGSGLGFGGMHRDAFAMMGTGGRSAAWYTDGTGPVHDIAAARGQAQRFAGRLGLNTAEVMQFTNGFYVVLDDEAGSPATEVLVDPQTGAVALEYGPAMMWNTRYGMMGGISGGGMMGGTGMMGTGETGSGMMGASAMMGRQGSNPSWIPPNVTGAVSAAQARRLASRWLSEERPGATAAEAETFPGYYTMDTYRNGEVEGMLSVSRESGGVWYHWWHGRFVALDA